MNLLSGLSAVLVTRYPETLLPSLAGRLGKLAIPFNQQGRNIPDLRYGFKPSDIFLGLFVYQNGHVRDLIGVFGDPYLSSGTTPIPPPRGAGS